MLENASKADKAYRKGHAMELEGLPIAIKDNIATVDSPATAGSAVLLGVRP